MQSQTQGAPLAAAKRPCLQGFGRFPGKLRGWSSITRCLKSCHVRQRAPSCSKGQAIECSGEEQHERSFSALERGASRAIGLLTVSLVACTVAPTQALELTRSQGARHLVTVDREWLESLLLENTQSRLHSLSDQELLNLFKEVLQDGLLRAPPLSSQPVASGSLKDKNGSLMSRFKLPWARDSDSTPRQSSDLGLPLLSFFRPGAQEQAVHEPGPDMPTALQRGAADSAVSSSQRDQQQPLEGAAVGKQAESQASTRRNDSDAGSLATESMSLDRREASNGQNVDGGLATPARQAQQAAAFYNEASQNPAATSPQQGVEASAQAETFPSSSQNRLQALSGREKLETPLPPPAEGDVTAALLESSGVDLPPEIPGAGLDPSTPVPSQGAQLAIAVQQASATAQGALSGLLRTVSRSVSLPPWLLPAGSLAGLVGIVVALLRWISNDDKQQPDSPEQIPREAGPTDTSAPGASTTRPSVPRSASGAPPQPSWKPLPGAPEAFRGLPVLSLLSRVAQQRRDAEVSRAPQEPLPAPSRTNGTAPAARSTEAALGPTVWKRSERTGVVPARQVQGEEQAAAGGKPGAPSGVLWQRREPLQNAVPRSISRRAAYDQPPPRRYSSSSRRASQAEARRPGAGRGNGAQSLEDNSSLYDNVEIRPLVGTNGRESG